LRADVKFWMGRRPSTPDSMPCIGYSCATRDVVHAFGHGHIGLSSAPITGRLAADLIGERPPVIDVGPFAPDRF
jgi:D-amino-acid dehydrogenase